jgi:DNA-directed RNA polymerase specialized sigma subunit
MTESVNFTILTIKEKEEIVLDLYFNQNKNVREIAMIVRMSSCDNTEIKNRKVQEKEREEHKSIFVQA